MRVRQSYLVRKSYFVRKSCLVRKSYLVRKSCLLRKSYIQRKSYRLRKSCLVKKWKGVMACICRIFLVAEITQVIDTQYRGSVVPPVMFMFVCCKLRWIHFSKNEKYILQFEKSHFAIWTNSRKLNWIFYLTSLQALVV